MKATVSGVFLLLYLCVDLPGVTLDVDPLCGGHLTSSRGVIHTPNFPGPFPIPIKCRWVIDVSDIPSTNSSIVVYLTQLYVYKGLRFTEYAYYESTTMNFGAALIKEVTEGNVFEYQRLRTFRPFLVIEFELDRLEGNHVRVLNDLLDVYGFNVTYEMTEEQPNPDSCTIRDCSFAGNCLVSTDYTAFWCDCFNGFSGRNCNEGPLCFKDEHIPVCQNEATCRQIGAEAMRCDCPNGYVGHNCEIRLLDTSDTECASENCILQCPIDEQEPSCTCKDGMRIYNNRSRGDARTTSRRENVLYKSRSHRICEVIPHSRNLSRKSRRENITRVLRQFASELNRVKAKRARERQVIQWREFICEVRSTTTLEIRSADFIESEKILTFSEVCKRGELKIEPSTEKAKISTDMTRCQEPQSFHSQTTMTDSGKSSWCEQPRYYGSTVTCGMLPTLRELASRGCNSRGTVCLVPFDDEMDAASHLQMTLLEAYCREIGIEVLSVPKETIRFYLCPGSTDLSCVLISDKDSYFPKLPKLPK